MRVVNAYLNYRGSVVIDVNNGSYTSSIVFIEKRFEIPDAKIVWFSFNPDYGISTVQQDKDGYKYSVDYSINDILNAIYH